MLYNIFENYFVNKGGSMKYNYTENKYSDYCNTISKWQKNNVSWEDIKYAKAREHTNEGVEKVLTDNFNYYNDWELLTLDEWFGLVEFMKESYQDSCTFDIQKQLICTTSIDENPQICEPTSRASSWRSYKKLLENKGFSSKTISNILKSTICVLKYLNLGDGHKENVKGLVVGNVQSGKTANIEAVMSMAADYGWNVFIILSGVIENLRLQTENRIIDDFQNNPFNWDIIEPSRIDSTRFIDTLDFNPHKKNCYVITCLKNNNRLKKLINKLHSDPNKADKMNIIIFDDEADQASINTKNISRNEESTINKEVKCLANGINFNSRKPSAKFGSLNYIAYTATPYANVLNESDKSSLFPREFIISLPTSNEYFGPQQIFGVTSEYLDNEISGGLDIVRIIEEEEINQIASINDGDIEFPKQLHEALAWFLCCVACRRFWGQTHPTSMLVHTSQRVIHHDNISKVISLWFQRDNKDIIKECSEIWAKETMNFPLTLFKMQYSDYDRINDILDYPKFENIIEHIENLAQELTTIKMDSEEEMIFSNKVHLCIDNGNYNKLLEDNDYLRLIYPKEDLGYSPAFIVVGGQTLSRGLTLEGLVSTYFLRTSSIADTLMQMGRWFGYRRGYELLPRIWLSSKCNQRFKFLSSIDYELRDQINEIQKLGKKPIDFGLKVKNSPQASFLSITSRNKRQSAQEIDIDFTGLFNQTIIFDNDSNIIKQNFDHTINYIKMLNNNYKLVKTDELAIKKNYVFEGVNFNCVEDYLLNYHISKYSRLSNDLPNIIEWVKLNIKEDLRYEKWNVVVVSNENEHISPLVIDNIKINLVKRSKLVNNKDFDDRINIKILTAPVDIISDMKKNDIDITKKYSRRDRSTKNYSSIPQLLLYIIDKQSKPNNSQGERAPLNLDNHLVGFALHIPGDESNSGGFAKSLIIKLDPSDCDLVD